MTLFQLDFFMVMLILMLVAGGSFVLLAILGFKKSETEQADSILSDKLDVLGSSVTEVDEAISELSDMSKNVFKEFESKYQELLFLYNLIDEKEKRIEALGTMQVAGPLENTKKPDINPKFANVIEMHHTGKTVEEIARELDMGKGEIDLILTLGGGRKNA
jgi:hypothetical protein